MPDAAQEWVEVIDAALRRERRMGADDARDAAWTAVRAIMRWGAGTVVRVPSPSRTDRRLRDARMRLEWREGVPAAELARRYEVSVARVYQVLGAG